ncbi:MAG: DNA repair protein RadC [Aerococcus sp.]|nr:DNA repair protein RadC [Aerococcus sp.]
MNEEIKHLPATTQMIRHMPEEMRPRERLREYGAKALPDYELLAIILRTGSRGENVIQMAMRILNHFDSLYAFRHATYEELLAIPGIGPSKALTIIASIALSERLFHAKREKTIALTSGQIAGEYFMKELQGLEQEHVVVAFVNIKQEVILKKTIFIGSLDSSVAHPREIFREAVRASAAHLFIAHNHPSGNAEPSQADIEFTKRLSECGQLMGIDVMDHFIIGDGCYTSLKRRGVF